MSTTKPVRNSHRIGLMMTASTISSEAADLMAMIGARIGNYTREGRIEVVGEKIGLSPSQARRIAQRKRKSVPAHVMDRLRALYNETCESLEAKARELNGDTHEADPSGDCDSTCADGLGDAESGNGDDGAVGKNDADPRIND